MDYPVDVRARWWFDHVQHTRQYVNAIFANEPFKAVKALRGLWHGIRQWQNLTGKLGGVLMAEHVILVKKFIEHAKSFRPNEADYLVSYLMENASDQTKVYKRKFDSFPADRWEKLLKEHIAETGAYIMAMVKGDKQGYEDHWNKVMANTKEIAQFSRSSFPVPEGLSGDETDGIGDEQDGMGDETDGFGDEADGLGDLAGGEAEKMWNDSDGGESELF